MNNALKKTILLLLGWCVMSSAASHEIECDVLVIGASTSGTAAGIQAARLGAKTVVVEETPWVGGMLTAAGVSAVDGNYRLRAGIWGEFLQALSNHYGGEANLKSGWVSNVMFEPSVGQAILRQMCDDEPQLALALSTKINKIDKKKGKWKVTAIDADGKKQTYVAKLMIDATELGDIAKSLGVGYDVGMESRNNTGEPAAPEYANDIIQDLTYAAILKDYGHDVTIPEPADYDPSEFACCAINELCINPKEPDRMWPPDMMITYGLLPSNKYMINWPIEGNDYYANMVDASPQKRAQLMQEAKDHTMKFVYFLQTALGFNTLGLADDEFPTEDLLPLIPYHRESRRIHGMVRFTLNHISEPYNQPQPLYRTCIAVGDYPVDQHHARYHGYSGLPNLFFYPIPSFGVPMGTMIPEGVDNLLVAEKSISVSNLVNGATRLQPVVLQIGTAAGTVAALAAKQNIHPAQVDVRQVQQAVLDAGGYLLPFLDVRPDDLRFKPYQRIGACGILQGEGRNVEWNNETWLRDKDPLLASELPPILQYYPSLQLPVGDQVTVGDIEAVTKQIVATDNLDIDALQSISAIAANYGFPVDDPARVITRGEYALIIDAIATPFLRPISIHGELCKY